MNEDLQRRLGAAVRGVPDDAMGATLRPARSSVAETIASPPTEGEPRGLPRISVDLRASTGTSAPSPTSGSGADLEVRGVIGEGGMGRVLVARQHSIDRDVAIKTIRDGAPENVHAALLAEGRITGRLEHPSIVPVHALGLDEAGRPALVMKRVEGTSWLALLRDPAHPGWEGWKGDPGDRLLGHLELLAAICNALHFAHSRGFVHRDVKPENVLVGGFGDVYLADWGVATRIGTRDENLCGTPAYMAPEMVMGGVVDERTDVYLLGAALHEVLTGTMRHRAESTLAALANALLSEPYAYPPSVPAPLAALANDACSADPAARPPSAKAFRERIERYLEHRESLALAEQASKRLERLEALAARDEPTADARAEIDRLIAEARFGLEQALSQWSGNEHAARALGRLEVILRARREREALLEREARERDPRIAARVRAVRLTVLGVVAFSLLGFAAVTGSAATTPMLLGSSVTVTLMIAASTFATRRDSLSNAFNRQVVAVVLGASLLVLAGRVAGALAGVEPVEQLARDTYALAGVLGVAAIAYRRWVAWIAGLLLLASFAIGAMPEHASVTFGAAAAAAISLGAFFAWRAVLRER